MGKYIRQLPSAQSVADSDFFVIDDNAHNYKVTLSQLKALLALVTGFEADQDSNYQGYLKLTLANGTVLRAKPSDPDKQDKLTFDDTPTQGSDNPVKSGGIFAALGLKLSSADYVNFTGATDQDAGAAGRVPAPAAGGARYLGSEGAWLVPDATPTQNSDRLVTSGGVYAAIQAGGGGASGVVAELAALVTEANNGKLLGIENGALAAVSLTAWTGGSY